jgi:hemolysin activation/secretion protein
MGGAQDLRGFPRQRLPADGQGRFSASYLGAELRWYKLLFHRIDPILLADVGRLGSESWRFDDPTYYSAGLGGRWETNFGVFRAYVARGEILGSYNPKDYTPPNLQVNFSFGEEF